MTRRSYLVPALAGSMVIAAAALVLLRGGSDETRGLEVVGQDVQISESSDADTSLLDGFSDPASIMFALEGDGTSPPYGLRFDLPADFGGDPSRLVAASRSSDGEMWALSQGQIVGDQFAVEVSHLSDWQLRILGAEVSIPEFASLERTFGARAEPPRCKSPSSGYELEFSDESGILLGPCVGGTATPELKVANNRAVSLEFDAPDGAEVKLSGLTLSESFYDLLYQALPGVALRLLPGAGQASVSVVDLPTELSFRATSSTAILDAALALLTAGRSKSGEAASINAVKCLYGGYKDAGESVDSQEDFLRGVAGLVGECGEAIGSDLGPQALVNVGFALGLPRLLYGVWDSVRILADAEATVRVGTLPPHLLPDKPSADTVARLGVSCGVIEDVIAESQTGVALELGVSSGEAPCSEVDSAVRGYLASSGPCSSQGAGTCVRSIDHWSCHGPTLAFYPVVVYCADESAGQTVVGIDRQAIAPGQEGFCGEPPAVEPPGPSMVTSNFADCEAALRIAEASFEMEQFSPYPYACEAEQGGPESFGHTCRFGDSEVAFISGR